MNKIRWGIVGPGSIANNFADALTESYSGELKGIASLDDKRRNKFGDKYKQWNAAFDAGYATALNKSMIVIHNDDHQHALKEVDAAASAVASKQTEAFRVLKYILKGSLK